ncbi:2-aminoethylphosphonate-pyruvate transaminase [Burkholderia pyrrocinia]|uniref:2-aminoethylphosphonate-pyruvate transaminase n=1 Tax=Burkholderia pyrrocinia TaxID=60550 RepID=A0A318IMH2_BURPY|nr:2-aminoethylphosphonate-pyruvate transaminase [Burkholderia pyrrocinia]SFW44684.1 2-aminoethylphosphonate-pyruvate transaminase [Burkholderia sp. NFACC33-1]SFX77450.1 2-aminoethylphosphonate-pyruvate transaminase [Burkholderia sp. NFPP32]
MICRLSTTCRKRKAKQRSEKRGLDSSAACRGISVKESEDEPNSDFKRFYQEVKKRDYIPYPGKLTEVETFRAGCIGHFDEAGIPGAIAANAAIADMLRAMGVSRVSAGAAS